MVSIIVIIPIELIQHFLDSRLATGALSQITITATMFVVIATADHKTILNLEEYSTD